jgi:hypothetical protein
MRTGRLVDIKRSFHTKSARQHLTSLPLCVTISSISSREDVLKAITHKQGTGLLTLSISELRTSS